MVRAGLCELAVGGSALLVLVLFVCSCWFWLCRFLVVRRSPQDTRDKYETGRYYECARYAPCVCRAQSVRSVYYVGSGGTGGRRMNELAAPPKSSLRRAKRRFKISAGGAKKAQVDIFGFRRSAHLTHFSTFGIPPPNSVEG